MMKAIRTIFHQSVVFIRQPLFILSIIIYVGLYLYRAFEDFTLMQGDAANTAVYYFLILLYDNGGLPLLLLTLNGLPLLQFVCDEWNNGTILYHLNRESIWHYVCIVFGKVLLLSWVFYMSATCILALIFATRVPFIPAMDTVYFQQFVGDYGNVSWLLKEGYGVLYYIALFSLKWWQHAVFYIVTICMSLYITNRYVIVTIPSILWTLCHALGGVVPIQVNPVILFSERLNFQSMQELFHYYTIVVIWIVCCMVICVSWFGFGLRHKIRSGQAFGKVNQVW